MIRKMFNDIVDADKETRHTILLKWMTICLLIAFLGFGLLYFFNLKTIGTPLIVISILLGNLLGVVSLINFFAKEPEPEEKYKRTNQPWE